MVRMKGGQALVQTRTIPQRQARHTMMYTVRRVLIVTALVLYAGLVFVFDVLTPPELELWVLSLPVIVVPVLFRDLRLVVFLSVVCSAVVAFGWVGSTPGSYPPYWDMLNRVMGLATLWLIMGMAIRIIKGATWLDIALRALELNEERLRLAMEGSRMGTFDVNLQAGTVACSANHF